MKFNIVTILAFFQLTFFVAFAAPISSVSGSLSSYVLVFENGANTPQAYIDKVKRKIQRLKGKITYEYSTVLTGFQIEIDDARVNELKVLSRSGPLSKAGKNKNSLETFYLEKDSQVSAYI
ncbi:hypothetical protein BABINDRAFT_162853 [Babjeviella inositovora NRRL Y-12698]|uniref:Inhibitor I9 domain-containing protein n=1 Tax=Babjeviella inositovora NRRL Y-12698 TaxID=984486 RepID=A0A1E3QM70_9ASCO|nr:uncharacterized protein BABINDRAFT_162853 [Babjeviella inositovora NRRL Y-12698]ODQ78182.1 hypothetical protein BABINDRAFT_162853 [Babjeviella inositovora NRRL Y-12698]